ncbi:3-hydroxyacyl-CoA dehydrogenase NAD-binding domain-containing protein [Amaricoccus solimangrovi]|uniref:3-hydroxyacyl-CoA dehydrogenase n=1 Tax=Amaricoccus solimangrovi TaxID=2589815 RepID=A0A501WXJ5_9RHOB|nr:3-hydroxyacyl-CoA dehydrogenase NAD-binding domain-containing protein [Amaricoccus solimangrovi]TPE52167.1 3-hydroxyacyl-CoA dehydrogenase [Amaricoccus solimangrovi]
MAIFTLETDAEGIATITWDLPGRSMNILTYEGIAELEAAFDAALADPAVRGIVLTSAKPDFAGGMDLGILARMKAEAGPEPARGLFEGLMNMHRLLRKIERAGMDPKTLKGGKPVAFASPGLCAGIGTEIALACHRRFLADQPKARIGLPEILLGIFPGAGGTTRVSRMLGLMPAAPILLEGRMLRAKEARAAGLVDETPAPADLLSAARAWVLSAQENDLAKPWDRKGFKMPGGAPYSHEGFMTFVGASAMVQGKTQGAYPAAKAMLSAIYEGALTDFDTALRIEARWFTHVLMNPSSSAMIRTLFLSKQALEKGASRPAGEPDRSVRRLGVIGAGMMGAGIAGVAAEAGIETLLLDRDEADAERGKAGLAAALDKRVARGRLSPERREEILGRITAGADFAALAPCDLVIEAVFEDPAVKADVIARATTALGPEATFATNTSTLPVSELARAAADPSRFIGIHFFSPVERMKLVEIILGRETGPAAIARALDFVRALRKTPITVQDARFFYANRCVLPYVLEGVRMVAEGVAPALIENAAKQLGFPLGPLQLTDEVSIDLGVKIARATKAALGSAYPASPGDAVLETLALLGRLGRKAGAGFYDYDAKGGRAGLWPGLADHWPVAAEQPDLAGIRNRLAMVQTLEAVRALDEGVLGDVREGDVGAILGWGYMPWTGGPFSWLDMLGAPRAVEMARDLAARHGARFDPPRRLLDLAESGGAFYPADAA